MGQETFYGGGAHGYTEYPTLGQSRARDGGRRAGASLKSPPGPRLSLIGHLAP